MNLHVVLGADGVYIRDPRPFVAQEVVISTYSATGTLYVSFERDEAKFPIPANTLFTLVRSGRVSKLFLIGNANDKIDLILVPLTPAPVVQAK